MNHRTASVLAALALITLTACETSRPTRPTDTRTIAPTPTQAVVEGQPRFDMTIPVRGQSTCIVPFSLVSEKGLFEPTDPYARSPRASSMYEMAYPGVPAGSMGGNVRWHNALFRDLNTGEEWLLLERRGVVGRWSTLVTGGREPSDWQVRGLLFITVTSDTNRDGALDDRDARVAIVTDPTGRGARAVTPPDAQVSSERYDAGTNAIFFLITLDTNRDGSFDLKDRTVPYVLPLSSTGPATPVVSDPLMARAEQLLR